MRLWGDPVAELIVPQRWRAAHRAGLERFLAGGDARVLDRRLEMTALRADGAEFPVELTISPRQHGGRWSFHAFIRDITERKESERERERLVEELHRALRGSDRRFAAIVGSLSDAITIRDRNHRFVYANPAAVAQLGFGSWEVLGETPPSEIMKDYLVWGEDGREIQMQDIPSVRILRGEPAEPLLIRTVNRDTGVQRWNLLKSAPLLDEDGQVEATITIIEDVTEQKRAELRGAFLADASAVLASSLDYEQTLRNVAELAVPEVADWCAVDLIDEDGGRKPVAVAHVDPARLTLAEELRGYEPERLDPDQGLGRVFRTGESLLYAEIPDVMLVEAAIDARHLELLRAVGLHSALIVSMRLGGRILGALTLVRSDSGRVLDQFDQQLAEQVAARAAVAIENSSLYSERSAIARTLQQSLLPEQLPEIRGYELASVYVPALQSSLVGGDFYDVWSVGESWIVIIGGRDGKRCAGGGADLARAPHHANRIGVPRQPRPAARPGRQDAQAAPDPVSLHRPVPAAGTPSCHACRGWAPASPAHQWAANHRDRRPPAAARCLQRRHVAGHRTRAGRGQHPRRVHRWHDRRDGPRGWAVWARALTRRPERRGGSHGRRGDRMPHGRARRFPDRRACRRHRGDRPPPPFSGRWAEDSPAGRNARITREL